MRIPTKPLDGYPFFLRPFFWNQKRKYGKALEAALTWARSPKLFAGVATLYGMIDRGGSPVEPALRSLVTVRVSQLNGCRFCVDINSATLMKRGVSEEKVEALAGWRESELFSTREKAVLAYTEAVTLAPDAIDDAVFAAVREHFDDDGMVELTGLIAFQNMSAKFNSALGIPPQGFCRIPLDHLIGKGVSDGQV
ncbi:MAG: carboxymuconolactone decarboxylase family protein [Hyphomicrobiales bacterium]|nr:MAG: carboxymuconolactone decarboxylase family protein [Hyphomicrobiales bacterium]